MHAVALLDCAGRRRWPAIPPCRVAPVILEGFAILACVSDRDVELVGDPSVPVRRIYAHFRSQ
jgi:hypothetical protein